MLVGPARGDAAGLAGADIDLHLNSNTLENLSELGILSGLIEPAHFVPEGIRFPFDRGRIQFGRHRRGGLDAQGGLSFERSDDALSVLLQSPSFKIRRHRAGVLVDVHGVSVRVAQVPQAETMRHGERFELKGLARYSRSGAKLMNSTFDSTYPHPGTPLGVLDITAKIRTPGRQLRSATVER